MKINMDEFKTWIAALDSGKYDQTRGQLQDRHGYCCLGVACKVTIPDYKLRVDQGGFLAGGYAKSQTWAPKWLQEIDDNFEAKTGHKLSWLNDIPSNSTIDNILFDGFTFTEIATLLELVYIHKILD